MREALKRSAVFASAGALIGVVLASLVAPPILAWNNTPGVGQALCNCTEVTHLVTGQLIRAQLLGALIGAVLLVIVGFFWRRRNSAAAAAAMPPQAS